LVDALGCIGPGARRRGGRPLDEPGVAGLGERLVLPLIERGRVVLLQHPPHVWHVLVEIVLHRGLRDRRSSAACSRVWVLRPARATRARSWRAWLPRPGAPRSRAWSGAPRSRAWLPRPGVQRSPTTLGPASPREAVLLPARAQAPDPDPARRRRAARCSP